jgi:hypothetical protein
MIKLGDFGIALIVVTHTQIIECFHLLILILQINGDAQRILQIYCRVFILLTIFVSRCDFEA